MHNAPPLRLFDLDWDEIEKLIKTKHRTISAFLRKCGVTHQHYNMMRRAKRLPLHTSIASMLSDLDLNLTEFRKLIINAEKEKD